MLLRAITLISGLSGAAAMSQFPEFSQQYIQRLAGQLDVLTEQVQQFDAVAQADGMARDEMLAAMAATPLVARQAEMWANTIARQERLEQNLALLRLSSPVERLTLPHRMADVETLQAVWEDYKPAVPLTSAGAISAGVGFAGGWIAFATLIWVLTWPVRLMRGRRRAV